MSAKLRHSQAAARRARVFAALGDETRLTLISRLGGGRHLSISTLADGLDMTRQAITKHLQVLETVGVVRGLRSGRESLFELTPAPIDSAKKYVDQVSEQWDQALSRLRSFVEKS